MRRLYGFYMTPEVLGVFCRDGVRTLQVVSPVPHDAKFWTSWFDPSRNAYVVVFEHDSFQAVPEGATIPIGDGPVIVGHKSRAAG